MCPQVLALLPRFSSGIWGQRKEFGTWSQKTLTGSEDHQGSVTKGKRKGPLLSKSSDAHRGLASLTTKETDGHPSTLRDQGHEKVTRPQWRES